MSSYGALFARVYNQFWSGFAQSIAPVLLRYIESTRPEADRSMLDLCCGTGQLLRIFCERGFQGVGIDRSEHMLSHARENLQQFIDGKRVSLQQGEMTQFSLPAPVALVTCTFDAINGGLSSLHDLSRCVRCVFESLSPGGLFIFDAMSKSGLRQQNHINLRDMDDTFVASRIVYDPYADRAIGRVTGFVRHEGGWQRFEQGETVTAWSSADILATLAEAGFARCYPAALEELSRPLDRPDSLPRIFFVAERS